MKHRKKMISKQKHPNASVLIEQILKKTWWLWLILILCLVPFVDIGCPTLNQAATFSWYKLICLTIFLGLVWFICSSLTDYFSLQKKETAITWCQILILVSIGLWIISIIWAFNIQKNDKSTIVFGIVGALLAWIFQEKVKGAVTFIHLRLHHLLRIDDWIQVPKYNVDGEVKHITLTAVTVYNWDTTTSTIPISALSAEHFINLQNMSDGKTFGRQMIKAFILDTNHFHVISAKEAEQLRSRDEITPYLLEDDIHEGILNAQLYRLYLYHWLMNNPHVSQLPRLLVRWLEHKEDGMPLEVNVFITKTDATSFEWQQSQIIEHVLKSLDWFGLRLFQAVSSDDIRNHITHLRENETNGRKEIVQ